MSFRELGLDARILKAVQDAGYTTPTPIQVEAIPAILAGQDMIGVAQTGTGKTAAFTLPILNRLVTQPGGIGRGTRVLVMAPTRELALQIDENVRAYGRHVSLTVATVFGGVGEQQQIRALRAGTTVIIACPGRLLDLVGRHNGDFSALQFLVLDEADRMLDMGFLPSIRQIARQLPAKRQTLLFSATLSKEIEVLTHEFQRAPKLVQIGRRSNPAETVTQLVYEVPKHLKGALLVHLLGDPKMNTVLVFSRMKHGADRIARNLTSHGIRTATLHSNRSQNQRLAALNFDILWWEMPHRRPPDPGEPGVTLPGGFLAPQGHVALVRADQADSKLIALRLTSALDAVGIAASAGAAQAIDDAATSLRLADEAMYAVKAARKSRARLKVVESKR